MKCTCLYVRGRGSWRYCVGYFGVLQSIVHWWNAAWVVIFGQPLTNSSQTIFPFPFFFFLLRKICPELTSVASLPFLCVWSAATAWPLRSGVGPRPGTEPGLPKQIALNFTIRPLELALFSFLNADQMTSDNCLNCTFRLVWLVLT